MAKVIADRLGIPRELTSNANAFGLVPCSMRGARELSF